MHTLNSASANPLPKQVLGPSTKVSKWRCPWTSFARIWELSSNHLSGRNCLAVGPQKASDLFIRRIGEVILAPFTTVILSTVSPDAVTRGLLSGSTSSSAAWCRVTIVSHGISKFSNETNKQKGAHLRYAWFRPREGAAWGSHVLPSQDRAIPRTIVPKWDQYCWIVRVLPVVSLVSRDSGTTQSVPTVKLDCIRLWQDTLWRYGAHTVRLTGRHSVMSFVRPKVEKLWLTGCGFISCGRASLETFAHLNSTGNSPASSNTFYIQR